jgi:hypothetical protein
MLAENNFLEESQDLTKKLARREEGKKPAWT